MRVLPVQLDKLKGNKTENKDEQVKLKVLRRPKLVPITDNNNDTNISSEQMKQMPKEKSATKSKNDQTQAEMTSV